jgi:hypothetical protein
VTRTRFDIKALGRLKSGQMNRTEAAYAAHLEHLKQRGDVLWYRFEGMKFRLADKTFLTPDFAVMKRDGQIALHDVKGGYIFEDAKVKMKVAAEQYPFEFVIVKKDRGGIWSMQSIGGE